MARPSPTPEEIAAAPRLPDSEVSKELREARAELAKLREQHELDTIKAEMERLKAGGKGPKLVAIIKDLEKVRAETTIEKDEQDGKEYALYLCEKRSYLDPTGKGGPERLNAENTVIRRLATELPDMGWKPVKLSKAPLEKKYVAA